MPGSEYGKQHNKREHAKRASKMMLAAKRQKQAELVAKGVVAAGGAGAEGGSNGDQGGDGGCNPAPAPNPDGSQPCPTTPIKDRGDAAPPPVPDMPCKRGQYHPLMVSILTLAFLLIN